MRGVATAEARYLIARARGIAVSRDFLWSDVFIDGEALIHHGPHDYSTVIRHRTEKEVPVP